MQDSDVLNFGGGNDLQIYHDGSNSIIKDAGTGQLVLQTNAFRVVNAANSENLIDADQDGAAKLYHNGSNKIETTSSGVTVTGTVTDSIGSLRRLGIDNASVNFTLTTSYPGKLVRSSWYWGNQTINCSCRFI